MPSTSGKAHKPLRRPSLVVPRFNQLAMDDWCPASRREKEAGHRWKLMYLMAEHSKAAYEVRKFEEFCGRIAMVRGPRHMALVKGAKGRFLCVSLPKHTSAYLPSVSSVRSVERHSEVK
jgi:hypothetical protein